MSGLEIVEYDDRWEEEHTEFARRNWPTKRRRQDPKFNRWKFRGPASGPVRGLLLATNGTEVIGQLGLLPGLMDIDGQRYPIQWACDLMVDPEKRLNRTGSTLFDVGFDRPDITVGSDPSPAATATMSKLGFTMRRSSSVMILTLRAGPVVSVRYPQLRKAAPLLNLLGAPAVRHLNKPLLVGARSSLAHPCGWRDVVDLVAAADAGTTAPHEVHDAEFLAWRCGGIEGWTRDLDAIRTDRGSFLIYEREDHRLTVHQWGLADPSEAASLFGRLHYVAVGYGVDNVQAYAKGDADIGLLTGLGFRARRTPVEVWSYPSELLDAQPESFTFAGYDSDYLL